MPYSVRSDFGLGSRPARGEVDGPGITSGGVDVATKVSIESGDVAIGQSSRLDHRVLADEGHVIHAAQNAPAGGLGQLNPRWIKLPKGVDRQTLSAKLALDEGDDQGPDLIQVRLSDV